MGNPVSSKKKNDHIIELCYNTVNVCFPAWIHRKESGHEDVDQVRGLTLYQRDTISGLEFILKTLQKMLAGVASIAHLAFNDFFLDGIVHVKHELVVTLTNIVDSAHLIFAAIETVNLG